MNNQILKTDIIENNNILQDNLLDNYFFYISKKVTSILDIKENDLLKIIGTSFFLSSFLFLTNNKELGYLFYSFLIGTILYTQVISRGSIKFFNHTKIYIKTKTKTGEVHMDRNFSKEDNTLNTLKAIKEELLSVIFFLIENKEILGINNITIESFLIGREKIKKQLIDNIKTSLKGYGYNVFIGEYKNPESDSNEIFLQEYDSRELTYLEKATLKYKFKVLSKLNKVGKIKIFI